MSSKGEDAPEGGVEDGGGGTVNGGPKISSGGSFIKYSSDELKAIRASPLAASRPKALDKVLDHVVLRSANVSKESKVIELKLFHQGYIYFGSKSSL